MKKPGKKDCVRVSIEEDIPEFLKGSIKIDGDNLILDCLEGIETVPIGSVIAYEKLDNGKMNVWNKANWKETLDEVDGIFYEKPKPNKAMPLVENMPKEIVEGFKGRLTTNIYGEFELITSWGKSTCKPGEGYLVIYGEKSDGSIDGNFLNKNTPSFENYDVLGENGEVISTLKEYDLEQSKNKTKNI